MNDVLKILLSLSLSGSLLILMLFFCKLFFRDKISRQWQYYIWLVVIARLLLPVTPDVSPIGNLVNLMEQNVIQRDTESNETDENKIDQTYDIVNFDDSADLPIDEQLPETPLQNKGISVLLQNSRVLKLVSTDKAINGPSGWTMFSIIFF